MASLRLERGMPGIVQPHTQPCTQIRGRQGMLIKYICSMMHVISTSYTTLIEVNYREEKAGEHKLPTLTIL